LGSDDGDSLMINVLEKVNVVTIDMP